MYSDYTESSVRGRCWPPSPERVVSWLAYVALVLAVGYTIIGLGTQLLGFMDPYGQAALMQPICLVLFNVIHSFYVFGARASGSLLVTVFLLSYALEAINAAGGIFFGKLEYSSEYDAMMGDVPADVPFSHYMFFYPCFALASTICYAHDLQLITPRHTILAPSDYAKRNEKSMLQIVLVSLTTGLLMGAVGAVVEPASAAYGLLWEYESGGLYFGIPFMSMLGWAIVGTVCALAYLAQERFLAPAPIGPVRLVFASLPLIAYSCVALVFIANGQPPELRGVAFFTLVPPLFLAVARLVLLSQRLKMNPNADAMDGYEALDRGY